MKTFLRIMLAGLFFAVSAQLASGQQTAGSAQDAAAALRSQLADVQAKETELQTRERQLDEDLRPENIERSFAGVGSTRPEDLREQRRRQLEGEKARVSVQLEQLAQSRTRLEAAIARADAEAYRRSAQVENLTSPPQPVAQDTKVVQDTQQAAAPKKQKRAPPRRHARRH
ncbi:MAG: hypothetical protein QOF02_2311 [Blastocatellia bacterium]|jgi:DNA repair exonuclease SbcCD ATPase subunit|nr:hypothetical protein [Blastocatellia bacterium]